MANTITAAKKYLPMLDEAYKAASKSAILDVAPGIVKAGASAGSFLVPKVSVVGLGTYSSGYPEGDVSFTWEEKTYSADRGRTFTIDAVDDMEAMGLAFPFAAAEFMRTQVVPELDAYRFAKIASTSGVSGTTGTLSSGSAVVNALNAAHTNLLEAEVSDSNLALFITPTLYNLAKTQVASSTIPCPVLDVATVILVPQSRFGTTATLNAGSSTSAGGYTKAGYDINFILMDRGAAFCDAKHEVPRIFSPAVNQSANGWKFDYRIFHDVFVWDNKLTGIYQHNKGA